MTAEVEQSVSTTAAEIAPETELSMAPRYVSAADLMPLPHSSKTPIKSKRPSDGAVVLTNSPFLDKLRMRHAQKETKTKRINESKRSLILCEPAVKRQKTASTGGRKRKRTDKSCTSISSSSTITPITKPDEKNPNCLFCSELYLSSKAIEKWIQCNGCNGWAHLECAGVSKKDTHFTCDFCND